MNEYNIIETHNDMKAISDKYLNRLKDILNLIVVMAGIGLEYHAFNFG